MLVTLQNIVQPSLALSGAECHVLMSANLICGNLVFDPSSHSLRGSDPKYAATPVISLEKCLLGKRYGNNIYMTYTWRLSHRILIKYNKL
jgi:hypothetical protein